MSRAVLAVELVKEVVDFSSLHISPQNLQRLSMACQKGGMFPCRA